MRVSLPRQDSGGTHWGIARQPFEPTAKDSLRIDWTDFGGKWLRSTSKEGLVTDFKEAQWRGWQLSRSRYFE